MISRRQRKKETIWQQVALDAFVYRVAKYVGAYTAAMNGVDAIAFTAGVGENDKVTRKNVCEYLGYLGVKIDDEANNVRGREKNYFCSRFQGKSYADPNQRRAGNRKRDFKTG